MEKLCKERGGTLPNLKFLDSRRVFYINLKFLDSRRVFYINIGFLDSEGCFYTNLNLDGFYIGVKLLDYR